MITTFGNSRHKDVFFRLALRAIKVFELDCSRIHHDTTTVTFAGKYPGWSAQELLTYGKNNRKPDSKVDRYHAAEGEYKTSGRYRLHWIRSTQKAEQDVETRNRRIHRALEEKSSRAWPKPGHSLRCLRSRRSCERK